MTSSFKVMLGRTERGDDVVIDFADDPFHWLAQGQTRSGKTQLAYCTLAQLCPAVVAGEVVIDGCDSTGVLLGPWSHSQTGTRATGTGSPMVHAEVLERIAREMDTRITTLTKHRLDKISRFDSNTPLRIVVLEEYAGLLAIAESDDQVNGRKGSDRLEPRIRRAVRRLLQEGAKVGIRVIMLVQRADANLIGGAERDNLALRISFRVDSADALRMLHGPVAAELLTGFADLPGVGFLQYPGQRLIRFRADHIAYAKYVAVVDAAFDRDVLS